MSANAKADDLPPISTISPCRTDFGYRLVDRPVSLPAVGIEREADIGGVLLSSGTLSIIHEGVRLPADLKVAGNRGSKSFTITIPAGEYRALDWIGGFPAPAASWRYDGDAQNNKGEIAILVDSSRTHLSVYVKSGFFSRTIPVEGVQFQNLFCTHLTSKVLRREILYSGGAKGAIGLQYREFFDDMARPAFSQELSFDLSLGKEIGFRGARIRIESISNTGVRYTLLKPLD